MISKNIQFNEIDVNMHHHIIQEINLAYNMDSKYTPKCVGYVYDEEELRYCLIMEYCSKSLQERLNENCHLSCRQIISYMLDIAEIVNYFHNSKTGASKNGILHRDFKPENGGS